MSEDSVKDAPDINKTFPQDVVWSVGLKYSSCESYSDEGVIETIDIGGNPVFLSFKTWFVRPNHYRYEWQDWSPSRVKSDNFTVICKNEEQTYLHPPLKAKRPVDLKEAIAGATGSSAGGAVVIPRLLMTELLETTQSLLDLDDSTESREDTPELGDVFVVEGVTSSTRAKCSLRISPDHVILRATLSFGKVGDKELYASYQYKRVAFDQTIPESIFR